MLDPRDLKWVLDKLTGIVRDGEENQQALHKAEKALDSYNKARGRFLKIDHQDWSLRNADNYARMNSAERKNLVQAFGASVQAAQTTLTQNTTKDALAAQGVAKLVDKAYGGDGNFTFRHKSAANVEAQHHVEGWNSDGPDMEWWTHSVAFTPESKEEGVRVAAAVRRIRASHDQAYFRAAHYFADRLKPDQLKFPAPRSQAYKDEFERFLRNGGGRSGEYMPFDEFQKSAKFDLMLLQQASDNGHVINPREYMNVHGSLGYGTNFAKQAYAKVGSTSTAIANRENPEWLEKKEQAARTRLAAIAEKRRVEGEKHAAAEKMRLEEIAAREDLEASFKREPRKRIVLPESRVADKSPRKDARKGNEGLVH